MAAKDYSNSYCVKCKSRTPNEDSKVVEITTKNGGHRRMQQAKCGKCGMTKSTFVGGFNFAGLLSKVGPIMAKIGPKLASGAVDVLAPVAGQLIANKLSNDNLAHQQEMVNGSGMKRRRHKK